METFLSRFKSFYSQPYQAQMNAGAWFLFIGFLLLCMIGWRLILRHVVPD